MSRAATLLFSIVAYAIFFATFLYLIVFVGDLSFAPLTVDRGGPQAPPVSAAVIDVALIALFGLQHSVMARPGFKRWWTRVIPKSAERSVYVLMASGVLIILMSFWRPIDQPLIVALPSSMSRVAASAGDVRSKASSSQIGRSTRWSNWVAPIGTGGGYSPT